MTRIFTEAGESVPVTVVEVLPNRVTQVKSRRQGRLSRGAGDLRHAPAAAAGQGRWPGTTPKPRSSRAAAWSNFACSGPNDGADLKPGSELKADLFKEGQVVDVTGITIGKGYAGVMKRHNFAGGMASHGASLSHRVPGSIGQRQTPGRVFPGKRMSGHMGVVRRTTENLKIVGVDAARNLLLIRGAVPGAEGGDVIVRASRQGSAPRGAQDRSAAQAARTSSRPRR